MGWNRSGTPSPAKNEAVSKLDAAISRGLELIRERKKRRDRYRTRTLCRMAAELSPLVAWDSAHAVEQVRALVEWAKTKGLEPDHLTELAGAALAEKTKR